MTYLEIDFQAGFDDDTVLVRVDSKEAFHKDAVNTDYSIGLADRVELELAEGFVDIEIAVPSKHLLDIVKLQVSATSIVVTVPSQSLSCAFDRKPSMKVYLGVSILDRFLDYKISDEMFLYF